MQTLTAAKVIDINQQRAALRPSRSSSTRMPRSRFCTTACITTSPANRQRLQDRPAGTRDGDRRRCPALWINSLPDGQHVWED